MIEVLSGGLYTTIQDYPGRIGYWHIGVPPSGPMDSVSFRIANRLVGNTEKEAGMEITAMGPTLRFLQDAVVVLTGAKLASNLDGEEIPWMKPFKVTKGSKLTLGVVQGGGFRSYLAIKGGFDVPLYLGSKSTFPHGGFGGHEGRTIKKGDVLKVKEFIGEINTLRVEQSLNFNMQTMYTSQWEIGVIEGPHSAPDFFTEEYLKIFFDTKWMVNLNANRLGYRLDGDTPPEFSREDGGEGGSHPSNINDYPYSVGMINVSGDTPIILTVDGPSLGGFISIATVVKAELWKVGQAKPHDTIKFKKITLEEALELEKWQNDMIAGINPQAV
ncbi:MAG: biotin-dependent carboxyltransferase family protein [Dethiosulfatibacter sp.]|nr:biotin-dependent carboxyltransferase family protein [Dethiosulfatibacter sp.]